MENYERFEKLQNLERSGWEEEKSLFDALDQWVLGIAAALTVAAFAYAAFWWLS